MSVKKSLWTNSLFNVIYNISNIIFPMIVLMYVSRILQPDGVGRVAYAQNIASYFVIFAALGLPSYGVREIAKVRENTELTCKTFSELFVINVFSTILSTTAYLVLIFSLPVFREDILLFLCCGVQIFMNLINIDWLYLGNEDYVYIACRSILIKVIMLFAVVLFVKDKGDYVIYALVSILGVCANYIFNVIHARKYVKFGFKNLELSRHAKPLLILALTVFLASVYHKIDVTMLGIFSTKSAVGLYSGAHKITEAVIVICISISAAFYPRLSFYYHNNREKFYRLIDLGIKILSFVVFPMTAGIFILAPQIITVMFGKAFYESSFTVRVFTLMIVIRSFGDLLCYQLLMATGNERINPPSACMASIVNVLLNAWLIPLMAQNGAAIASVVSEFVLNLYEFVIMRKILGFCLPYKAICQGIFSSAVMGLAVYLLIGLFDNVLLQCSIGIISGMAVYCLLNLLYRNEIAVYCSGRLKKYFASGC